MSHCIRIYDTRADIYTVVCKFGKEGDGAGQFNMPYGVSIVSDSLVHFGLMHLLVADSANHRVQVLRLVVSSDGTGAQLAFVRYLGNGPGAGQGELCQPTWTQVWKDDTTGQSTVFVAEYGNQRVSKFNLEGSFLGFGHAPSYTSTSAVGRFLQLG
jgi:hypothetical protein